MTTRERFLWHEDARLFTPDGAIPRPDPSDGCGFCEIRATPTAAALRTLGQGLIDGAGFCVSGQSLPQGVTAQPGYFLTLSGGTSGPPKIIHRSHASWIESFRVNAARFDYTAADAVAVLGGLSHSLALYGLLEALHTGLDAHALDSIPPSQQRARLDQDRITILYATPAQLRLLCRIKAPANQALRLILCGGGQMDPATRAAVRLAFPHAALHVFYGAAETSFVTMATAKTPPDSVGPAYPGVTLEIRNAQGFPTVGLGEVWVRSPYLSEGYATNEGGASRDGQGFMSVGELGQLDAEGNLLIKGRKTRMLTIADHNVFPEDVEAILMQHAKVDLCAVVALPDALRGHRLIAVIQGKDDMHTTRQLRAACHAALSAQAVPHRFLYRREMPLLASGKVDLAALSRWVEGQL